MQRGLKIDLKKLWSSCIKEAEKTLNKLNIKINTLDACRLFRKVSVGFLPKIHT
ncbi:hypothetical protein LEP1GSC079_0613 [Leptospira interrogans str. FPW1039]|uniref:Uncharacterized protein n=1 Tax=Leptospira interrogans str. FPW1039 TaxID=1193040 RepID=A0A0F6IJ85_LEPIR|nr:hypothetical protein LEP1GSC099_0681 [Leptospira interrogans str. UI 08452]EMJ38110.1 hypothetical protein LEP1GSC079_0613 [Leptospira interrogans str. FPW1039]EMN37316.1 hypothetical protein LEP1GSC084_3198 [Leptospira interrogans serovar Medanensis str. L0448]EMN39227.1 hypothetical protein LEP1GSC085_1615 [Leptospira interrogans str. L0996]EMN95722.1 hypothetical protein LEP1GSC110_3600 [Leptospira interrogans serovar Medanensis str. UT053]